MSNIGKLDPNQYRRALDDLRVQVLQHRGDAINRCSELSPANHVPVAALLCYASHLLNDPSLLVAAEKNARWYGLELLPLINPPAPYRAPLDPQTAAIADKFLEDNQDLMNSLACQEELDKKRD